MAEDTSKQLAIVEAHFKPLRPQFEEMMHGSAEDANRLVRSIMWAIQDTEKLLACSRESLLRFGMTVASLKLEPEPKMGQIFCLPFDLGSKGGKREGPTQAQTVMGYKGYNTLGWRDRISINGNVVRKEDEFTFVEGTDGHVHHIRKLGHWASRPIIAAWATATAVGRAPLIVVMDIDEIEDVREKSPSSKSSFSPWNDKRIGFTAMCIKTPKRRLGTRALPFGAYSQAATMEEAVEERGLHAWIEPERGVMIEGERAATLPGPQPQPSAEETGKLGKPPLFPIHKNGDGTQVYKCASIAEWRGRMEVAIGTRKTRKSLGEFREWNASAMSELHGDFPDEVGAVANLIETRLKALQ